MKIKDKLIHLLGGLTEEDAIVRTRPVISISRFSMETLRVQHIVRQEMLQRYPEYMDRVHNDMTYRIADRMLEEHLVEFVSKEESRESMVVTATARIFRPES